MALHELATNALKHGALSSAQGRVSITWSLNNEAEPARLYLLWQESGGPTVEQPRHRGFGSQMIERVLAAELGGKVEIDFKPTGLICMVDAPLPDLGT